MIKQKEKIKDVALKQLFKFKLDQLNSLKDNYEFSHPIASETIWLFSHSFDSMYEDKKMLAILNDSYNEIKTKLFSEELLKNMTQWTLENNYNYEDVFGK